MLVCWPNLSLTLFHIAVPGPQLPTWSPYARTQVYTKHGALKGRLASATLHRGMLLACLTVKQVQLTMWRSRSPTVNDVVGVANAAELRTLSRTTDHARITLFFLDLYGWPVDGMTTPFGGCLSENW
jgi:hypothetical protein